MLKELPLFVQKFLDLISLDYWLIGKQSKAVKWWKRAIEETERLRTRPDLARTYMEIGKRFLEENSKYKELNGIIAKSIWRNSEPCSRKWIFNGIWINWVKPARPLEHLKGIFSNGVNQGHPHIVYASWNKKV